MASFSRESPWVRIHERRVARGAGTGGSVALKHLLGWRVAPDAHEDLALLLAVRQVTSPAL